jgi:hypothetical protein
LANIASTSAVVGTGGGAVIGFAIMANCSLTIAASTHRQGQSFHGQLLNLTPLITDICN